jgi:predicted transposase YdaD
LRADKVPDNVERVVLGSAFVLCGLRYSPDQIEKLYRDLSMTLEDSTTYQLIFNKGDKQGEARGLAQGRAAEAQRLLLSLGGQRFGAAAPAVEALVRAITDPERLQRITDRLLAATSWDDLLATP